MHNKKRPLKPTTFRKNVYSLLVDFHIMVSCSPIIVQPDAESSQPHRECQRPTHELLCFR